MSLCIAQPSSQIKCEILVVIHQMKSIFYLLVAGLLAKSEQCAARRRLWEISGGIFKGHPD